MPVTKIKTVFSTMGLAILVGVISFGVNAAIGATPTENPPGATISPTFDDTTVTGTLDAEDATVNSLLTAEDAAVTNNLDVGGTLGVNFMEPETGNNITVNVAGTLSTPSGNFRAGSLAGENVTVWNNALVHNTANRDLTITANQISLNNVVGGDDLLFSGLKPVFQSDIEVQGQLEVGAIDSSGDLDVFGAVTADRFGTVSTLNQSRLVGAGASGSTTLSCPVGSQRISCGYWAPNQTLQITQLYPSGNGCTATGYNGGGGNQTFWLYTYCLNPSL